MLGLTTEEIKKRAERAGEKVNSLSGQVKRLRGQLRAKEAKRTLASKEYRQRRGLASDRKACYDSLRAARETVRAARLDLMPKETELRQARSELYYWNNVARYAGKATTLRRATAKPEVMTALTWSDFKVEDRTESLDIRELVTNYRGKRRQVVFAGTDYGVVTMSETVPQVFDTTVCKNA